MVASRSHKITHFYKQFRFFTQTLEMKLNFPELFCLHCACSTCVCGFSLQGVIMKSTILLGDEPNVQSVAPEVAAGGKELARQPRRQTDSAGCEHRPFPLFITCRVCSP